MVWSSAISTRIDICRSGAPPAIGAPSFNLLSLPHHRDAAGNAGNRAGGTDGGPARRSWGVAGCAERGPHRASWLGALPAPVQGAAEDALSINPPCRRANHV